MYAEIIDPDDHLTQLAGIGPRWVFGKRFSKLDPKELDEQGILWIFLPADFGSRQYYLRKKENFEHGLDMLKKCGALIDIYDYCLGSSFRLREYLWVYTSESEELTRAFLNVAPNQLILSSIRWAIEDFWDRQHGWPDLFIYKEGKFRFIEIKSKHDSLSPDQKNWFIWALKNHVPCELCKLERT